MEEKKTKKIGGITFTGGITINGPMFDIHDNQHVHVNVNNRPEQSDVDYEFVDLSFFDDKHFSTMEGQEKSTMVGIGPMSRTLIKASMKLAKEKDFPLIK